MPKPSPDVAKILAAQESMIKACSIIREQIQGTIQALVNDFPDNLKNIHDILEGETQSLLNAIEQNNLKMRKARKP